MKPRTITDHATGKVTRTKVRPWSPCGKFVYSSRKLAKASAKRQSRDTGELIEAYHCANRPGACHGWHIGHPPGSRSRWAATGGPR